MTVFQLGEHLGEHFEELHTRHLSSQLGAVFGVDVCPLEAQLLLLVGKEAVALVDERPEGIEVALRRVVVVVVALLARDNKDGNEGKEECEKSIHCYSY